VPGQLAGGHSALCPASLNACVRVLSDVRKSRGPGHGRGPLQVSMTFDPEQSCLVPGHSCVIENIPAQNKIAKPGSV
jgi:hypothetical protein